MAKITKIEKELLSKIEEYKIITGKTQELVNEEIAELEIEGWPTIGIIGAIDFRIYRWRKDKCLI